jgi:hypothetical protein
VLIFATLTNPAIGQFSFSNDKVHFRIYNKQRELVKNATVFVNGFKMQQNTSCKLYSDHFCYETDKANVKKHSIPFAKFKLNFSHPDYLNIDDSLYITGAEFYALGKKDNYIYKYNKMPCIIRPNCYFVHVADSAKFESWIKTLNIPVLSKFFYCPDLKNPKGSGPLIYIVKVLKESFQVFIDQIQRYGECGLLISRDTNSFVNCSGLTNRISFIPKNINSKKEIELYLKTIPEIEVSYFDNYDMYHVKIKREYLKDVIKITDELLSSGYFQMPDNELMIYVCTCN